jgi:Protein of unknown function (DUF3500)
MKFSWCVLLVALGYVSYPPLAADRESAAARRRDDVVRGTADWLAQLSAEQRAVAQSEFVAPNRLDWHFIPRDREGLTFTAMTDEQRAASDVYLRTLLPPMVHQTVRRVIDLENVLRYHFTVFGEPSAEAPFAVRFEGHHVAINLTQVGARAAWTPFFLGSNPATVKDSQHLGRGERVLGFITDQAVAFIDRLPEDVRERARLGKDVPGDVLFGPGVVIPADLGAGIELNWQLRADLALLIDPLQSYVNPWTTHRNPRKTETDAGDRLAFAGSTELGQPLYLRICYRGLVIEYANVQNGANHVHLLIRDRDDDFGVNLLADHLKKER